MPNKDRTMTRTWLTTIEAPDHHANFLDDSGLKTAPVQTLKKISQGNPTTNILCAIFRWSALRSNWRASKSPTQTTSRATSAAARQDKSMLRKRTKLQANQMLQGSFSAIVANSCRPALGTCTPARLAPRNAGVDIPAQRKTSMEKSTSAICPPIARVMEAWSATDEHWALRTEPAKPVESSSQDLCAAARRTRSSSART
mmetsp:Transcript_109955/g.342816  ORF Transcript_109955/g.342816 Transcript_109955/m.342816 type:complete len:200 (+) Transcript_109955:270-869(+)